MANYRIISTPEYPNGQVVPFTEEEEAQRLTDIETAKVNQEAIKVEQDAKDVKKASGKQKLKDLGLDDAEIKALTGA